MAGGAGEIRGLGWWFCPSVERCDRQSSVCVCVSVCTYIHIHTLYKPARAAVVEDAPNTKTYNKDIHIP